jgi:hypothetical protein
MNAGTVVVPLPEKQTESFHDFAASTPQDVPAAIFPLPAIEA